MPYQITEFDDVALPVYNPLQDHSPAAGRSGLTESVGGIYDQYGTGNSRTGIQTIPLTGLYYGETEYIVDETGDRLVDETGDYVIAGDTPTMLRAQVLALAEKVTTRGRLVRIRLDDNTRQWKMARLQQMNVPQDVTDRDFKAEITCQFETGMQYWQAEDATTHSADLVDGVAKEMLVENGGMPVSNAVVTVTRTSGTITAFALTSVALGIGLVWVGELVSADVLTIDAGAQTVIKNTTDAYGGFGLSGHSAKGWLPIPRGQHVFVASVLGGNATVEIEFYTQTP